MEEHPDKRGYMPEFTTRMPELRARKGLTQEQLAELIGASKKTIVRIEKGSVNPSLRLALDIAHVLEAPVEEIFTYNA